MTGILGDYNCEGHVAAVVTALEAGTWREFWTALNLRVHTFAALGFPGSAPDDDLWRYCQREQVILITANRNADGPTSLEAVIRAEAGPRSLPVFTLADADRVLESREYANRVAEQLIDYLYRIDDVRGTGRLYLP